MKTSTRFAILAFGAASLASVMISPASAQARNCSRERDSDVTNGRQCLKVPTDIQKDNEGNYLRDSDRSNGERLRAFFSAHPVTNIAVRQDRTLIENGNGTKVLVPADSVVIVGNGYKIINGVGFGTASVLNTRSGQGGSGGKHGSAN